MIVTLAPRGAAHFAATALPKSCQGPALQYLMTLRVTSWSMYPALCKGDYLELGPPDPFQLGDLIVFRKPFGLVCHRLVAQHDECILTKGDATTGAPERVMISDVLGIVTAVVRGSTRVQATDLVELAPPPPWAPVARILDGLIGTLQENSRRIARRMIRPALQHPRLGRFIAGRIARYVTMTQIGTSPVQAFNDAVTSDTSPLSPDQKHPLSPLPLLALRLGPIALGLFHPHSNRLDIRPLLSGTAVESALARMTAG
ncbi:MAG: PeptidaseS24 domain-containing protein [Nitrospira sp.]|nr:MAG: PeptidaseS24 domain-containing protein [Nitrospira sp.]